ncbi:MAG: tRNA pseudouridine(38-40) synthase TruA [bacterium]
MPNFKVCVEYEGTNYFGWQRQKGAVTVQQVIEDKLSFLLGEKVYVFGSGRTDSGVHAINQYFHFRTKKTLPVNAYLYGLNSMLPADIRIKNIEIVPDGFHACFSAKRKSYKYLILNRKMPSALLRNFCWHISYPLDVDLMNRCAETIVGTIDFSSFRASLCSRKNPVRTVYEAFWNKDGEELTFFITANGFLHNMVRILVGTMVDVGRGKISLEEFKNILEKRDRRTAGRTAPPQGLYLYEVYY